MTDTFLESQVSVIESQIGKLNEAINFLYSNPHKSYTLDTGQTRQSVTRDDISMLQDQVNMLLDRRSTILARCQGATVKINPYF